MISKWVAGGHPTVTRGTQRNLLGPTWAHLEEVWGQRASKGVVLSSTQRFWAGLGGQMESKMESKTDLSAFRITFYAHNNFDRPYVVFVGFWICNRTTLGSTLVQPGAKYGHPQARFWGGDEGTILGTTTNTHAFLTLIQGVGGYIYIYIYIIVTHACIRYIACRIAEHL